MLYSLIKVLSFFVASTKQNLTTLFCMLIGEREGLPCPLRVECNQIKWQMFYFNSASSKIANTSENIKSEMHNFFWSYFFFLPLDYTRDYVFVPLIFNMREKLKKAKTSKSFCYFSTLLITGP